MYSQFLRSFTFTSLLLALLVIAINGGMDPYGILGTPKKEGVNLNKPQAEHHQRLIQAVALMESRPKVLFMGSSRTRAGMLPDHALPYLDEKGFNLGLSAVTVEEMEAYLKHAYYLQPALKAVYVDLDPFMFNQYRKLNPQFDAKRLHQQSMIVDDYVGVLFTFDSLVNSFITLKANVLPQAAPSVPYKSPSEEDWHFMRDISIAHAWFGKYEIDSAQVEHYQNMARFCQEKGIALHFYFSPAQAHYWEVIDAKNLWEELEVLKTQLAGIYPYFDFSGYNGVTTCEWEKDGPFYTDCSHYTPIVGEMIMARLHGRPDTFGYWMSSKTVAENLKGLRAERQKWLERNQEMSARIHATVNH